LIFLIVPCSAARSTKPSSTDLRAANNGGWAMGGERFERKIARALKRRVALLPKGRPPKERDNGRQLNLL